ncbi:hypothetical protein Tco_0799567 [Tanacetum coccineum]|uniref:Helitron helicase-like domain-containing protein n=1 Tax=Tanacetum coccineum TaxID=301880 RepID=A0ABQ4ZQN7_9ASTR
MVNPAALDDSNTPPHALAATEGRVVLDFENSSVNPSTNLRKIRGFWYFVDGVFPLVHGCGPMGFCQMRYECESSASVVSGPVLFSEEKRGPLTIDVINDDTQRKKNEAANSAVREAAFNEMFLRVPVVHERFDSYGLLFRGWPVCSSNMLSGYCNPIHQVLYTIEFQKQGLPHCHTLLWVDNKDKIQHAPDIDRYISAELPDPITDPEGYRVISEMMVHGPCGPADPNASCMKENVCSKKFPKKFNRETFFDKDGHVHYRRRDIEVEVTRKGIDLDNCYTVSYNRQLCLTFHAHINVEYCGWSMLIKYLFKYISKGTEKIVTQITKPVGESDENVGPSEIHVDEIQNFVDGRFICPHEACWRILRFKIHNRHPTVQILSVHLENKQIITFRYRQPLQFIANNDGKKMTTLTEWLEFNKFNECGRHLTYIDFPKEFLWYKDSELAATSKERSRVYWSIGVCPSKFRVYHWKRISDKRTKNKAKTTKPSTRTERA